MPKIDLRIVDERAVQMTAIDIANGHFMNFGLKTFAFPLDDLAHRELSIQVRHEGTPDAQISVNFMLSNMSIEDSEIMRDWLDATIQIAKTGEFLEPNRLFWITDNRGWRTQQSDHNGGDENFSGTMDEMRSAISYYFEAEYGDEFTIVDAATGHEVVTLRLDADGNVIEEKAE